MAHERIRRNPKVMGGQPVIAGTRIPVATILDDMATGSSEDDVLSDYPHLTLEDIKAAIAYSDVN
ncbi:MAG: DUF433 domain-containing protein [Alphaproteobacteria bacterium]|nr:DUF433 domain-containing protein [Alphaproteobacteria bacterium]